MKMIGLVLSLFVALPCLAQTEDLVSITVEGSSTKPTASEASREITAWAQGFVAREQAIEVLGETRYQKKKGDVEKKVIQQSSKFIPFMSSGEPKQGADRAFKMPVTLKVSMPTLRKLILDSGLLNEAGSPVSLVPFVSTIDRRKGQSARWWLGESTDPGLREINELNREVLKTTATALSTKGIHVVMPTFGAEPSVPEALRVERPQGEALTTAAKQFNSPLVMRGDVRLSLAKEDGEGVAGSVKIDVVHASSGRTVADVAKSFETRTGGKEVRTALLKALADANNEVARQVAEAWQRGTLNARAMRLALRGKLTPKQLQNFKLALGGKVREVRELRERVFERDMVTFEVNFTGEPGPLASRLKALDLPGFDAKVADASEQQITLDVRAQ